MPAKIKSIASRARITNRAIEFDVADKVPVAKLRICISMALTYHRKK